MFSHGVNAPLESFPFQQVKFKNSQHLLLPDGTYEKRIMKIKLVSIDVEELSRSRTPCTCNILTPRMTEGKKA